MAFCQIISSLKPNCSRFSFIVLFVGLAGCWQLVEVMISDYFFSPLSPLYAIISTLPLFPLELQPKPEVDERAATLAATRLHHDTR